MNKGPTSHREVFETINFWLDGLAGSPEKPEALEAYRHSIRQRRELVIPTWFGGAFLIGALTLLFSFLRFTGTVWEGPHLHANFGWQLPLAVGVVLQAAWIAICVMLYSRVAGLHEQPLETRRAYEVLLKPYSFRWLNRKLGRDALLVLNEGARRLLQCRESLANPVWKSPNLAPSKKRAAEDAGAAAESGMFRIVRLVIAQGDLAEAHSVVTQLEDLSESLARLTARQEEASAETGEGQASLRAALLALKELEVAEAEVQRETRAR